MTYTRAFLDIYTKGYPVGKILKCNIWIPCIKVYTEAEITELLNAHLVLDSTFRDQHILAGFKVNFAVEFKEKDDSVKDNVVIIQSEKDFSLPTLRIVPKHEKVNFKKIRLKEHSDDEILELKNRIEIEMFKRQYELTDEEFNFYMDNQDINFNDIKTTYTLYQGDPYKLRKEKIREKLFPIENV